MRVRAVIALLSEELLGVPLALTDFPVLKAIRGIGMSDSPELAKKLAEKLDYTNTFYHQAPRFDAVHPDPNDFGRYDFILSSEVMEHVPPPVEHAFANLFRLLKPDGLLIMTTPYTLGGKTKEHFPELHDFTLTSLGAGTVLVNRRRDGSTEVFEDLVFHGGPGSTVEMRVFTEESLRETILAAGFSSVRVASMDVPEFGVEHAETWSLPIVARKGTFHPPAAELSREYRQLLRRAAHLEKEYALLQADYQRFAAHHTASHQETNRELDARYEWGMTLDGQLREVQQQLADAKAEQARLEARKWIRLGRKLGTLD
jgi:SAM-dependent methyltransferase